MTQSPSRRSSSARSSATPAVAVAVAAAAAAGVLVVDRHLGWAALAVAVAGAGLVVGTVLARRSRSPRAVLAVRVADPVFDASVLGPLAWIARDADPHASMLALAGLGLSFVACYERARAQSLGYRAAEGIGYRATRAVLLVVGLAIGPARLAPALWAFAALAAAALVARAVNVVRQERGAGGRALPAAG